MNILALLTPGAVAVIRDVVVMSAEAGGAVIAGLGLKTWRRQLRGHTEYDLVRRLLRAAYSVRDQVASVRSPFIWEGEMKAALSEAGMDDLPLDS